VRRDLSFQAISDLAQRERSVHTSGQIAAIDVMLVEQVAARDPRPVDPALLDQAMQAQRRAGNIRTPGEARTVWQAAEWQLRLYRAAHEMMEKAPPVSPADLQSFYDHNRENFYGCAIFRAAHIVKHINIFQPEAQARAGIEVALVDLEAGVPFAEAVRCHSDCKERGGEFGPFRAGTMAPELEDAIRDLKPGQRTGIFRTKDHGYHIAELREKIPAGPLPFEEVREDIRRVLTRIRGHQQYLREVAAMRAAADVRWVPETETPQPDPVVTHNASTPDPCSASL